MTQSAPRELTFHERVRCEEIAYGLDCNHMSDRERCELTMREGIQIGRAESASPETPRTTDEAVGEVSSVSLITGSDKWTANVRWSNGRLPPLGTKLYAAPRTMATQPAAQEGDAQCESRIARLMHAVEGECDGLAINADQAWKILDYVDRAPAAPTVAQADAQPFKWASEAEWRASLTQDEKFTFNADGAGFSRRLDVWAAAQTLAAPERADDRVRQEAQQARWLIAQLIDMLPTKRDWLDPTVERLARDYLATKGQS